jgi:hypothetical protein
MRVNSEHVSNKLMKVICHLKSILNKEFEYDEESMDGREDPENAFDLMHVNSESVSNEIDKSDAQHAKHEEQRI